MRRSCGGAEEGVSVSGSWYEQSMLLTSRWSEWEEQETTSERVGGGRRGPGRVLSILPLLSFVPVSFLESCRGRRQPDNQRR